MLDIEDCVRAVSAADGSLARVPPSQRMSLLVQVALRGVEELAAATPTSLASALRAVLADAPLRDPVAVFQAWIHAELSTIGYPAFDLRPSAVDPTAPRVLLVSPTYRLDEASIGLVRIAFFLRGLGIGAEWVSATPDTLDDIVARCARERFDVIGQGTTHYTFADDLRLVRRMAEASPDSRFLLGGHGAALDPSDRKRVLRETPISVIIRGFGERSTARIALRHWIGLPPAALLPEGRIPGVYVLGEREDLLETGVDAYDDAAFRTLHAVFDGGRYPVEGGTARFMTSTHCPFACVFCSSKNFPEQPATRLLAEDVMTMVRKTRAAQPALSEIEFNDDNFSIGYRVDGMFMRGVQWLKALCRAVRPGDLDGVSTYCYTRADTIDDATLALLYDRLNLRRVGIGLEHVDVPVLRLMKKGTAPDMIVARIRKALELGIYTNFFIILFCKWETRSSLSELLRVTTQLCLEGAHAVYNFGFQPLGGADVSRDPTNVYLEEGYEVGDFSGRYRAKIVPDDPFVGAWFRRMHEHQGAFFALQDELIAEVRTRALAAAPGRDSLWLARVLRPNKNINLSDTLTNLIRIHSMFVAGLRWLDPDSEYLRAGATAAGAAVDNYVYNGPSYAPAGGTSVERKIAFLARSLGPEQEWGPLADLIVEFEVVYVGLGMPDAPGVDLGPAAHVKWAELHRASWRERLAAEEGRGESGATLQRARLLLECIETRLGGVYVEPDGPPSAAPRRASELDYIS